MLVKIANETEVYLKDIVCVSGVEDRLEFIGSHRADRVVELSDRVRSAVFTRQGEELVIYLSPYSCQRISDSAKNYLKG